MPRPKPPTARGPLSPERRDLAATAYEWALKVARPWLSEELRAAAVFGLLDAAAIFDESRGFAFTTLVTKCARSRLRNAVRDATAARRRRPRPAPLALCPEPADPHAPPDPDAAELAALLVATLDPRDAAFFALTRVDGVPAGAVAGRYGCHKETVLVRTRAALDALRDHPAAIAARP